MITENELNALKEIIRECQTSRVVITTDEILYIIEQHTGENLRTEKYKNIKK